MTRRTDKATFPPIARYHDVLIQARCGKGNKSVQSEMLHAASAGWSDDGGLMKTTPPYANPNVKGYGRWAAVLSR